MLSRNVHHNDDVGMSRSPLFASLGTIHVHIQLFCHDRSVISLSRCYLASYRDTIRFCPSVHTELLRKQLFTVIIYCTHQQYHARPNNCFISHFNAFLRDFTNNYSIIVSGISLAITQEVNNTSSYAYNDTTME